jgi:CheY-like chemotaxis protein
VILTSGMRTSSDQQSDGLDAGAQLAESMLSVRPDIPVIVCTGFSETINEQIARDIGIKGFLMKPIVISQLACMVRSALDGFSH